MPKNSQPEKKPAQTTFIKEAEKALGYSFRSDELKVDWTTGGLTGGNCWGGEADQAVEGEKEPEFQELDEILEKLFPTISFLQYKKLYAELVVYDTGSEREYYGNYYTKGIKKISLTALEEWLNKNKLL